MKNQQEAREFIFSCHAPSECGARFLVSEYTREGSDVLFVVDEDYQGLCTEGEALWGADDHENLPLDNSASKRIGRGAVRIATLKNGQKVVIRQFLRGGILAKLNRDYFLLPSRLARGSSLTHSRPYLELIALSSLRAQNVAVPRPVAVLVRRLRGLAYHGWIVTELIEDAHNLLALVNDRPYRELRQLVHQGGTVAKGMLAAGVVHRDLHLGNLLVTPQGLTLIDFDKADIVNNSATDHHRRYLLKRFRRSAIKHGLPELTFDFAAGLLD